MELISKEELAAVKEYADALERAANATVKLDIPNLRISKEPFVRPHCSRIFAPSPDFVEKISDRIMESLANEIAKQSCRSALRATCVQMVIERRNAMCTALGDKSFPFRTGIREAADELFEYITTGVISGGGRKVES